MSHLYIYVLLLVLSLLQEQQQEEKGLSSITLLTHYQHRFNTTNKDITQPTQKTLQLQPKHNPTNQ